jgi:hypothetical protein
MPPALDMWMSKQSVRGVYAMTEDFHANAAALIVAVAEKSGLLEAVAKALRSVNKPPVTPGSAAGYKEMIRQVTPKQTAGFEENDWSDCA